MSGRSVMLFTEICKDDIQKVGGKCANLGELVKIGIPVPPGYAITTDVFDIFMERTGAQEEIQEYLKKFPEGPRSLAEVNEASETIDQILSSKNIPGSLQEEIVDGYERLCESCVENNLAVAVRSSGIAEDMVAASFAGQYETYLNVSGTKDLIDKVKQCWISMFSARGISYRAKNQMPVLAGSISVAVMKMIRGRSAGVGFTVHPLSGDDERVVIEGSWGIGEIVVQGIVTPDTYVINKQTLVLEDKRITAKSTKYEVLETGGICHLDVCDEEQSIACLSDEEAAKIGEYACIVEKHYGAPQDIEWVVDSETEFPENVYLVQARSVTAVPEKKSPAERALDHIMGRMYQR